jgi:hypothetical protein
LVLSFCSFLSISKWVFFLFYVWQGFIILLHQVYQMIKGFGLQLYNIWYSTFTMWCV